MYELVLKHIWENLDFPPAGGSFTTRKYFCVPREEPFSPVPKVLEHFFQRVATVYRAVIHYCWDHLAVCDGFYSRGSEASPCCRSRH